MKRPTSCGQNGQPCERAIQGSDLDKFDDSVPPELKQCVPCWNALNSPEHRRLWGLDEPGELQPQSIVALPRRDCCGDK